MDKEEARFILNCFRPDGADADSEEFSEALRLAAADRELGEWLAKERSSDAEFSEALGRLALPEGLREEILAGLAAERGDFPPQDAFDRSVIAALAAVSPPASLRGEILTAMRNSVPRASATGSRRWWRFGVPVAAAAGIVLAFMITHEPATPAAPATVGPSGPALQGSAVPVSHVVEAALSRLKSGHQVEIEEDNQKRLFRLIRKEGRPCPEGCVPRGLRGLRGIGCMKLDVDGKPGMIVCFRRGAGEDVHMVVFKASDVEAGSPDVDHRVTEQLGDWAVARWAEKGRVFLLLGDTDVDHLDELF